MKNQKIAKKSIFLWEILLFLAESLLYMFSAFFWGILHICSSKFEISTFFGLKNLIFDLRHLTAHSRKNIPHRGLFLVSMESQRSKYLSETKFRLVGGLLAHIWRLKSIRAIMAPPRLVTYVPDPAWNRVKIQNQFKIPVLSRILVQFKMAWQAYGLRTALV